MNTRQACPPPTVRAIAAALAVAAAPWACAQTEIAFSLIPGSPQQITAAVPVPGNPNRILALTRFGGVRMVDLAANTFLPGTVAAFSSDGSSNGTTGLAIHPRFADNGVFYAWRGISVIQFRMLGDPLSSTQADPAYTTVIRIPNLGGQHVGGWIGFAPNDADGVLWISTGDSHTSANGQRTDNLFGRILRIDVDGPDNIPGNADDDAFPADANKNYSIPTDNPFLGDHPGLDEIWAFGLRNPFRCSFDAATADFWIADVGEGRREEINHQPAHFSGTFPGMAGYHGGRNYGWSVWEGSVCRTPTLCPTTPYTPPIAEYVLGSAAPIPPLLIPAGSAVIGGYVYRGCAMPELGGWFVFGDAGSVGGAPDFIWALRPDAAGGPSQEARQLIRFAPSAVYGFAQDAAGELYLCGAGGLYRIGPASVEGRDLNNNGALDSCEAFCGTDFNADGALDPDDLSDFIAGYFAQSPNPACDWDKSGSVDPDDLATYIAAYFACVG